MFLADKSHTQSGWLAQKCGSPRPLQKSGNDRFGEKENSWQQVTLVELIFATHTDELSLIVAEHDSVKFLFIVVIVVVVVVTVVVVVDVVVVAAAFAEHFFLLSLHSSGS